MKKNVILSFLIIAIMSGIVLFTNSNYKSGKMSLSTENIEALALHVELQDVCYNTMSCWNACAMCYSLKHYCGGCVDRYADHWDDLSSCERRRGSTTIQ